MPRPALFVLFVSLLIAPAAARALNLDRIANGEFDDADGSAPWTATTSNSGAGWAVFDADGCIDSGSMLVWNSTTLGSFTHAVVDGGCFAVTPGEHLQLSALVLTQSSSSPGSVRLGLREFPTIDCSGSLHAEGYTNAIDIATTGWQRATFADLVVDASQHSVEIVVEVIKNVSSDPETAAWVDRIFVGNPNLIADDDFEIGATCRWSSVAP